MDQPKGVRLTIEMTEKGFFVHGPIHDKILCLGMLEMAKDAVKAGKPEPANVIVPKMVPPFIKN